MKMLIVTRFIHKNYGPWIDIFRAAGHSVTFVTLGKDSLQHPEVMVYNERPKPLPYFFHKSKVIHSIIGRRLGFRRVNQILRAAQPDIIICREMMAVNVEISLTSRWLLPKSKVFYYDQEPVTSLSKFRKLARLFISRRVFTPNCHNYEAEKLQTVPATVIPFSSDPHISSEEVKKRYTDIEDRKVRLVSIGKLFFEKYNFDALFDAIDTDHRNKFELLIIGQTRASMPDFERKIDQRAAEINAAGGHVTIMKNLLHDEVKQRLRDSDVMLLPGFDQVASFSQFEGMSFGLPVVICRENGTAFAVKDGFNGLVTGRDSDSIHKALSTVLEKRFDLVTMGLNSLDRLNTEFSTKAVTRRFQDLFQ